MKAKVYETALAQNFSASVMGLLSSELSVFNSSKYAIFQYTKIVFYTL